MDELTQLESALAAQIDAANDEAAIEAVRVAALGKKGSISEKLKSLGSMSPEERQSLGPAINGLKNRITEALTARKTMLKDAAITARLATEKVDVTLPLRASPAERGRFIPSARRLMRSRRFSPIWVSPSPKVLISRPTIIISPR